MDDALNPFAREAAKETIIAKRDRIVAERAQALEHRAALLAHIRRLDRELSDCRAAARLFELDVAFPDEDDDRQMAMREEERDRQRRLQIIYEQRRAHEAGLAHARTPVAQAAPAIPAGPQRAYGGGPVVEASKPPRPAIKDIIVEQLCLAAPEGRKAVDLREHIERTYGESIHEKTVGMTLYRLSKDRLVRRNGHTWFSATAPAETENPGGETPGSDDLLFQ